MVKKTIALFLCLIICVVTSVTALAEVQPRYSDTDVVQIRLSITGTKATCGIKIIGKAGTENIDGYMELQDENGNVVNGWSLSADGELLNTTKTATVEKGQGYTLYVDATVYRNGSSEDISVSKDANA